MHVNDTDTIVIETALATLAHTVTGYGGATADWRYGEHQGQRCARHSRKSTGTHRHRRWECFVHSRAVQRTNGERNGDPREVLRNERGHTESKQREIHAQQLES